MVLLGLGGLDVVARGVAEDELVERVHAAVPGSGPTTATIDSFPFLGRLAVAGEVRRIHVHQEDVEARGVRFSTIDVELRGVRIDRTRALWSQDVELTSIERGRVTAVVGLGELLRLAGAALIDGVRLEDGAIVIGDVRIELAGAPLLPCVGGVRVAGATVVLTCDLTEVPAEMLREANRRIPRAMPVPSTP